METLDTDDIFSRSRLLLGDEAYGALNKASVIIFGVGGVGGWAAETLVRTGLGQLTIVDFDTVAPSNINRQMPATVETVGQPKVDAVARRLLTINPDLKLTLRDTLYTESTAVDFDLSQYDYIIDAIDSVADKALLINTATRSCTPLYSSMGAALRVDPSKVTVSRFDRVTGDKLAAALRQRFKRDGLWPAKSFKAVWSTEQTHKSASLTSSDHSPIGKRHINGSLMQVTATFGLMLASLVINDIVQKIQKN